MQTKTWFKYVRKILLFFLFCIRLCTVIRLKCDKSFIIIFNLLVMLKKLFMPNHKKISRNLNISMAFYAHSLMKIGEKTVYFILPIHKHAAFLLVTEI